MTFLDSVSPFCTSETLELAGVSIEAWERFQRETEDIGGVITDITLRATRVAAVFADDSRDGKYLAALAACGAAYALDPLNIESWYEVDNYVPSEHAHAMDSEIAQEFEGKRILRAGDWQVEGEAALGIVVKIKRGKVKNRPGPQCKNCHT